MQPRTHPDGAPEALGTPVPVSASAGRAREALPLATSAVLHAALLVALAYALPLPRLAPPPPVESIAVELLSEEEIAALTPPREEPSAVTPEPALPPPPPAEPPLVLAHAETLYSGTALGRRARRELGTLALDARFEQLCDVEAMEQIARSGDQFRPERAVAYATADIKVMGNLMIAEGAAFLSAGHWYRLSFRCKTTPDRSEVVSFDFATGEPVTEGRGLSGDTAD